MDCSYSGYSNNVRVATVFMVPGGRWGASGRFVNPWAPNHQRQHEHFVTLAEAQSAAVSEMPPRSIVWVMDAPEADEMFDCPCGDSDCRGRHDDDALIRLFGKFYASDCRMANNHPEVVRGRDLDAQRDERNGK